MGLWVTQHATPERLRDESGSLHIATKRPVNRHDTRPYNISVSPGKMYRMPRTDNMT